jgi:glyoxylase-like metal-dependent hydrolase (beta-lactamase superfamily II)
MTTVETDLYFQQVPVGEMANLAYLIGSRSSREAVIVDPAWSVDTLLDRAEADGMAVVGALATHYHQDHVGGELFGHTIEGLGRLLARQPVPIHVHREEARGLCKITGASESDLAVHESGDSLTLGGVVIRLLHTPGHTPGSQCFLVETPGAPGRLVSGDTLFLGSCGRVDLPGSDPEAMFDSLHNKLAKLPDETLLYPGHMYSPEPSGTLGSQKTSNPYLRVTELSNFLTLLGA